MFHFSCVVKKCSALHNSVDILNPSFNKKMWKIMTKETKPADVH